MVDERGVRERFGLLAAHLDERSKRAWGAAEAISLGYGGTEAVVRATGVPRPYDLRHSFARRLLAEGRQPLYVAKQLGHSLAVLFERYAHLIDEYAERDRIDASEEISAARAGAVPCSPLVPRSASG